MCFLLTMPIDIVIGKINKLFHLSKQQQNSLNREGKNIAHHKIEVAGNIKIFQIILPRKRLTVKNKMPAVKNKIFVLKISKNQC